MERVWNRGRGLLLVGNNSGARGVKWSGDALSIISGAAGIIRRMTMVFRIGSSGAIAAVAGAALLALLSGPSSAFTLSSPPGQQQALNADIQDAYWGSTGVGITGTTGITGTNL